jgi:hypothetical protein
MFNICKQQEKHVYEITEYDVKDVVNVSVSDMCMQSSPCKHYCTIEFKDGKKLDKVYSSTIIYYNFQHLLSEEDKEHVGDGYESYYNYKIALKENRKFKNRIKRYFRRLGSAIIGK